MFDVGFSEMILTGIIALVVLGPERLPKVARTAGMWAGRARRFLSNVKADIDREMKAEELRQLMEKQAQSSGVHEIVEQTRTAVAEIKSGTNAAVAPVATAPQSVNESLAPAVTSAAAPVTPAPEAPKPAAPTGNTTRLPNDRQ